MVDVAIFSKNGKSDPRVRMDIERNSQLNAIGLLKVRGKFTVPPHGYENDAKTAESYRNGKIDEGVGSGWLINECLVMTNHHVAYMDRSESESKKKDANIKIEFFAGIENNTFAFQSSGKVIASEEFMSKNDLNKDWAIIRLDKSVKNGNWRIEPYFLTIDEAGANSVMTASYYQDKESTRNGRELWGEKICDLYAEGDAEYNSKGSWLTDCAGIAGTSGSPVFAKQGDRLVAFGLMQSVNSPNKYETNIRSDMQI